VQQQLPWDARCECTRAVADVAAGTNVHCGRMRESSLVDNSPVSNSAASDGLDDEMDPGSDWFAGRFRRGERVVELARIQIARQRISRSGILSVG
jgi:hypothetical protein